MIQTGGELARFAAPVALMLLVAWLLRRRPPKPVRDGPKGEPYRIYTRDFDLTLRARAVAGRLAFASPDARMGYLTGEAAWEKAAAEMEALRAGQRAAYEAGRDPALARLREAAGGLDPGDVTVTLLIDQSGSMKGAPIAFAAASAAFLADLLADYGARFELLGFSTAGWKGGHARSKWIATGKPPRPGRLCALMHVVYKSADEPALDDEVLRVMVHPDLLRENVDGEAILWARERLAARGEPHRLLIVVSDGAPVDDSTLAANGPSFLFRHLMAVLRETEADPRFTIGGVGIQHDVEACYWLAATAPTPAELFGALVRLLEQMIAAAAEKAGAQGAQSSDD